jgi:pyruvate/2-oxoglutarate dehydrogenase complex dihydrolipoamide acyltransferase (E2) component
LDSPYIRDPDGPRADGPLDTQRGQTQCPRTGRGDPPAHRRRARRQDAPEQLGSGTFTLNNYGVFGVDGSAAIINHPEVAILGVGRIIDKPWVVDGELAVRKVTELTLTFDHRVCDGGAAAGFLRFVADAIENPASVLADI